LESNTEIQIYGVYIWAAAGYAFLIYEAGSRQVPTLAIKVEPMLPPQKLKSLKDKKAELSTRLFFIYWCPRQDSNLRRTD
jgi:hypothetical protein